MLEYFNLLDVCVCVFSYISSFPVLLGYPGFFPSCLQSCAVGSSPLALLSAPRVLAVGGSSPPLQLRHGSGGIWSGFCSADVTLYLVYNCLDFPVLHLDNCFFSFRISLFFFHPFMRDL